MHKKYFIHSLFLLMSIVPAVATENLVANAPSTDTLSLPAVVTLSTSVEVDDDWGNGYEITVTLTNPSSSDITRWKASFDLGSKRERITDFWDARYKVEGITVRATKKSPDGEILIPAGGSTSFGFRIQCARPGERLLANLQASGTSWLPTPDSEVLTSSN